MDPTVTHVQHVSIPLYSEFDKSYCYFQICLMTWFQMRLMHCTNLPNTVLQLL